MAGRVLGNDMPTVVLQADEIEGGSPFDGSSPQRGDGELRRMAAFRVRETANRIAALTNSAENERLRQELLTIREKLLCEERALLDSIGTARGA